MLYIYTDKKYIQQRKCIEDIESFFVLQKNDIVAKYEKNESSLVLLEKIEGMTYHEGDFIKAKFGSVSLDNISTGGKGCLLMSIYHNSIVLSTDEMGYNCIFSLAEQSIYYDIYLYSSAPYTYFPDNIEACINNVLCHESDEIIDYMETCYE